MAITIISTSNTMNGDGSVKEVLVQFGGSNLAHVDYISGTIKADSTFHNLSTDAQQKVVLDKIKAEFWPEPFNEDKIDAINQTVVAFTAEVEQVVDKNNQNAMALQNAVNRVAKQVMKSDIPAEDYAEMLDIFPAWIEKEIYEPGDIVRHNEKAWEVIQGHTSESEWTPEKVPALFKEVTPKTTIDEESGEEVEIVPEFKQPTGDHDAYKKGDKVNFEGVVYESTIDANTYTPAAYPQGWKQVI